LGLLQNVEALLVKRLTPGNTETAPVLNYFNLGLPIDATESYAITCVSKSAPRVVIQNSRQTFLPGTAFTIKATIESAAALTSKTASIKCYENEVEYLTISDTQDATAKTVEFAFKAADATKAGTSCTISIKAVNANGDHTVTQEINFAYVPTKALADATLGAPPTSYTSNLDPLNINFPALFGMFKETLDKLNEGELVPMKPVLSINLVLFTVVDTKTVI